MCGEIQVLSHRGKKSLIKAVIKKSAFCDIIYKIRINKWFPSSYPFRLFLHSISFRQWFFDFFITYSLQKGVKTTVRKQMLPFNYQIVNRQELCFLKKIWSLNLKVIKIKVGICCHQGSLRRTPHDLNLMAKKQLSHLMTVKTLLNTL